MCRHLLIYILRVSGLIFEFMLKGPTPLVAKGEVECIEAGGQGLVA